MTEAQRDYLADLAGRKGVRLEDTGNVSAAWASVHIEDLKAMPDVEFGEVPDEFDVQLQQKIDEVIGEVSRWTLTA